MIRHDGTFLGTDIVPDLIDPPPFLKQNTAPFIQHSHPILYSGKHGPSSMCVDCDEVMARTRVIVSLESSGLTIVKHTVLPDSDGSNVTESIWNPRFAQPTNLELMGETYWQYLVVFSAIAVLAVLADPPDRPHYS